MAGEDSFDQEEGLSRAFWAVELVPGKEFSTILPLDLKITQAVLPASAKDTGRSVVSITFVDEPSKTLSIVSLKLDSNDSQSLEVVLDEDSEVKFTVSGKNPVHLSGYYVPNQEGPEGFYDDEDDEIDSDEVGDEIDDDESEEEEASPQILAALEKKRKAAQNGAEANKKVKSENAPQQPKKEASTPNKPQQQQPKGQQQQKGAQNQQKGAQQNQQKKQKQQK
jgi:FK506-binding nuclear protein